MQIVFWEYFDGVTPPALPSGFSTSFTPGPANCVPEDTCAAGSGWITSASAPDTPPNCAFHDDPSCVTDSILNSRPFFSGLGYKLTFRHSFDLENGFDGAVLEISTNGGPFVDIVAAGGGFNSGGYNGTIANGFFSPIAGRSAWTGNSNGYITTDLYLPFTNGTRVLRFRLATDCKGAGTGWKIDTVKAFFLECGTPSPTPSPTPTPTPTPTATPFPTPTPGPEADIAVMIADSPDPVTAGQNLTYTITVSNLGRDFTSSVTMSDDLPASVNFVSVTPSQGSCSGTTQIICSLGGLEAFNTATVTLVVTPTEAGPLSNNVSAFPNAHDPSLSNNSATASTTVVSSGSPTPTPTPTATATATPTPTPSPTPASTPTKALNLSTRMRVQTGNNVGIGGFIIVGNAPKDVAIRGIGPSLGAFGITDALADPTLELRDSNGGLIKLNDDWTDNAADAAQLALLGLAPSNPKESGIVATLQPDASYTAILAGKNQTVGVGLVEIYDVDQAADSQLANISTR
ncbi:MAG: hypothetical protein QOG27_1158, partial [Verrucomicrobiota bacterium]